MNVESRISDMTNKIRRFSNYYHNAGLISLDSGVNYYTENAAIIKRSDGLINDYKDGLLTLKKEINIKDDLYTIALLNKNNFDNRYYGYFSPVRERYLGLVNNNEFSLYQSVLDEYGVKNSYKNFNACDLAITEEYIEDGSKEKIRTIIYPLYKNKELMSILMIDVKNDYFLNIIRNELGFFSFFWNVEFNLTNNTHIFDRKVKLNCSNGQYIRLHFSLLLYLFFLIIINVIILFIVKCVYFIFKNEVYKDDLTGLYRRNYIKNIEVRKKAILFIDIDHFKKVNDIYGHDLGDKVISSVAEAISENLRKGDYAFRWGGEEFLLILDNVINEKELFIIAERLRIIVESLNFSTLNISVSIGGYLGCGNFNEGLEKADNMLYKAKKIGRNRSVVFDFNNKDDSCL